MQHRLLRWSEGLERFLLSHGVIVNRTGGAPRMKPGTSLTVNSDAVFHPHIGVFAGQRLNGIGSFSYTQSPLWPGAQIGRYCSIGADVKLMGTNHLMSGVTTSDIIYHDTGRLRAAFAAFDRKPWPLLPNEQGRPPVIGNDVWIGAEVVLRRGIQLHDGCVIGTRALVTKDVPPYAIVGGVPARIIGWRLPEEMREKLQALRWWDYAYPEFSTLRMEEPESFVAGLEEMIGAGTIQPFNPKPRLWGEVLSEFRE